ncbi:MAG: Na+/H+ antiporter subunit E [Thermoplasmata archaeon]
MSSDKKVDQVPKRHYVLLDVLLFIFWFLLTGFFFSTQSSNFISYYTLFMGVIATSLVTYTAHEFVIRGEHRQKTSMWDYLLSLKNAFVLLLDVIVSLIIANAVLIYQTITMAVEPKVMKVKVSLTSESEVTLISMMITMIPGTLVLDAEEVEDGYELYVHYSYLKAEDLEDSMEKTIKRWDKKIRGLFK